jgi:hypothetical protein
MPEDQFDTWATAALADGRLSPNMQRTVRYLAARFRGCGGKAVITLTEIANDAVVYNPQVCTQRLRGLGWIAVDERARGSEYRPAWPAGLSAESAARGAKPRPDGPWGTLDSVEPHSAPKKSFRSDFNILARIIKLCLRC